jgi:Rrf2 family protein
MRMGEGVEWGVHCCLALALLGDRQPVPVAKLAAMYELPQAYLNKRLQALVRAGILASGPGVRGGFRLARPLDKITLMDVVVALEGPDEAFQCTGIRQRGAGAEAPAADFALPCSVATAMRKADLAWRRQLAAQTLAEVMANAPKVAAERTRRWYERTTT